VNNYSHFKEEVVIFSALNHQVCFTGER